MSVDPTALRTAITDKIYLAEQLDLLHLSLINLFDMSSDGEIDLILDQPGKSTKQKALYIQKVVDSVTSPLLKEALIAPLKAGELEFFSRKELLGFIKTLQQEAERFQIVKLTVAIQFKDKDIKEMASLLAAKAGHPIALLVKVERSMIGGAIIQYGNYITDYSIKSRIDRFRASWHKAALETQA